MFKKTSIFLLLITLSYSSESTLNKLYYDDIDLSNQKASQKKINSTYLFGMEILKESLISLKETNNETLIDECNESLYLAIFNNTIVDKLGRTSSYKKFEKDCEAMVKQLKK